jgi:hypothetical protein
MRISRSLLYIITVEHNHLVLLLLSMQKLRGVIQRAQMTFLRFRGKICTVERGSDRMLC